MKFLILFLISFNLFAASYLPESKVGQDTDGLTIYSRKSKCEKKYSEPCIKFKSNESYKKIKPDTWLKMDTVTCTDNADCDSKFESIICSDLEYNKIKNYDTQEVYCTKFEKMHVVDDLAKKALKDAEEQAKKDAKKAEKDEKKAIKKMIQNVNDSSLPKWHKRLLKMVIKDMK